MQLRPLLITPTFLPISNLLFTNHNFHKGVLDDGAETTRVAFKYKIKMPPYGTTRSKLSKMCQGNAFAFPEYATTDADIPFVCWQYLHWVVTHRRAEGSRFVDVFGYTCHAPCLPGPRTLQEKQGIIKLIDLCLSLIQVAFILGSLNLAFSFSFGATEISPSRESKLLDLSSGSKCLHSMNKIYCPLFELFWWL